MHADPENILFISLSCVGDAIMTTPVLESLHSRFPGAVMDIVSDARSNILYQHCPYRGNVFLKDKKKPLRGALDLLKAVRYKNYDLIVDLRTDGLAYLCRGRERLTKWGRRPYGKHAVEQLMGVIRRIHGDQPIPAARVWLSDEESVNADRLLADLPGNRWLALVPGNINDRKLWPVENYAALANALSGRISGVILDGSPEERTFTAAVAARLKVPYVDLAGRTNLLQAAAVLQRASLFIGADSGPGHMAAAVGTPTLTFFSVDTPERVLPWGKYSHWLNSRDGRASSIPLEEALKKADEILTAA